MSKTRVLLAIAVLTLQLEARQSAVVTGASIEGTVVDMTTGNPISGVRLAVGTPIPGRSALSATSDAEGHFVITGVPAGSHRVTTAKDGYAPAKPEARKTSGSGLAFTVTRDEPLRGVLIRLAPQGVITGKVIDTNGSPVVGAMVIAVQPSYDDFGELTIASAGTSSTTNDNGAFRIFGLAAGQYNVRVSSPTRGVPLPSITYVLYYPSGSDLSRAQIVSIRSGEEIALSPIVAPVIDTAPVRFNIVTDAPNLPGQIRSMQFAPRGVPDPIAVSTTNQANGGPRVIENPSLALGPTDVRVVLYTPDGTAYGEAAFDVRQSMEKLSVEVVLRKGVRLVARVMSEMPDGSIEPLRGVQLSFVAIPRGMNQLNAQTSADGMVSLGSVPPSEYRLTASGLPDDVYIVRASHDGKTLLNPTFRVKEDTRVEIMVSNNGRVIDGLVQDSRGRNVPGSLVALVPAEQSRRGEYYLYRSTTTDQDGKFALRSVQPGAYKLFAWIESSGPGPFRNAQFMAKYEDLGKQIQVGKDSRTNATLQLADEEQ